MLTALRREWVVPEEAAGLIAGLTTVTLWGSAFIAIRSADAWFSPGTIALGRLIVSCALLIAFAAVRGIRMPPRRDLAQIAVYGVLWLGAYSVLLNAAERTVDGGTAAMLVNAGPIVIAVLAGTFLHEGFPPRLFVGCAIAFAGCALIAVSTSRSHASATLGVVLCCAAMFAYAVAVAVQKPVLARVASFEVTLFGCLAALVACLPFTPSAAAEIWRAPEAALWLVYLGAFPTAIGFATWGFALRRTSAGRAGALNLLIPVVAVVLGAVLLHELPHPAALAGGALCIGGVFLGRRGAKPSDRPARART